jgi:mannose-6-phosphate isomerase-like protein (cupin superfamily)
MSSTKLKFSNPILKDEIEILFDSKDILVFNTSLQPQSGQTQLHYHTKITETFKVILGNLQVTLDNDIMSLKENEVKEIKPFTNHQFYNATSKTVIFEVTVNQPGQLREGLQIMYGLANDDKVYKNGLPKNLLKMAIGLQKMDAYIPGAPRFIQKMGISILARLGKVVGLEQILLNKYCN